MSIQLDGIAELAVTIDGEDAILPIGTELRISGTDNDGIAYFTLEAGSAPLAISRSDLHFFKI